MNKKSLIIKTHTMKNLILIYLLINSIGSSFTQLNPAITSWLQNTTTTGSYYVTGNSTALPNNILVNCQSVKYSNNWAYITTTGVPAYVTGPFQDGNPSQAQNQNAIFKMPLNPTQNTGTLSSTTGGNIGIFINGVALFDTAMAMHGILVQIPYVAVFQECRLALVVLALPSRGTEML